MITLNNLLELIRYRLRDTEEPYLWSDDELISYADIVVRNFFFITRHLREFTTLTGQTDTFILPEGAFEVIQVILLPERKALQKVSLTDINDSPVSTGMPKYYAPYMDGDRLSIKIYPSPEASINLEVHFFKTISISETGQAPIPSNYLQTIIFGIMSEAFTKDDTETFNPALADKYKLLFEQGCEYASRRNLLLNHPSRINYHRGLF